MKYTRGAGVVRSRRRGRRGEVVQARCSGCGVLGPERDTAHEARDEAVRQGWEIEAIPGTNSVRSRCPSCAAR